MEKKTATTLPPGVLWLQVWGLASVQGAISISWLIYRLYLPQLLAQFGFVGLDKTLPILEDAIAVVVEPFMGGLSDQARKWLGSRFPFIAVGIIVASALFIAIPTVVIFGNPESVFRWLLPWVLVLWAVAMAAFRSPAIALLGQYAFATKLPQAASVLILVGSLIGSLRPLAGGFILSLGPAATFGIGSLVLLASAGLLRSLTPDSSIVSVAPEPTRQPWPVREMAVLFVMGMFVGWTFRLSLFDILPKLVTAAVPIIDGSIIGGSTSILLGIGSVIAGIIASRWGNRPVMLAGVGLTILMLGILNISSGFLAVGVAIAFIACFSLLWNGAIPLVFTIMPQKGGLGIGIYFGGFSAAMSLYSFILPAPIPPSTASMLAAIALMVAGLCVAITTKFSNPANQPVG